MVTKLQRRKTKLKKLHLLRALTCSKSVKRNSIFLDAILYIFKLKIKVQQLQREYQNLLAIKNECLMKHIQFLKEVKVEKIGERFLVKITCKKEGDELVSILEAFEKMGLNVLQAKVSCSSYFAMEAIVVAQDQEADVDVKDVTQAVIKATEREGSYCKSNC